MDFGTIIRIVIGLILVLALVAAGIALFGSGTASDAPEGLRAFLQDSRPTQHTAASHEAVSDVVVLADSAFGGSGLFGILATLACGAMLALFVVRVVLWLFKGAFGG